MKLIARSILVAALFMAAHSSAGAQFYQMNNGSYMTGYGQVNGSFGYAMATQQMYQTMQNSMQTGMLCRSQERAYGRARTLKANPNCEYYLSGASSSSNTSTSNSKIASRTETTAVNASPAPKYLGKFSPVASLNVASEIAIALSEDPDERAQIKQVINTVKAAYEKEAASKGWKNNVAGGMAFFMIAMNTVYHDKEITDEEQDTTFTAVNLAIDSIPEVANASNKDKQKLNDMLIGFAAIPFMTYLEGKQNGSKETLEVAKQFAGEMWKLVFKADPEQTVTSAYNGNSPANKATAATTKKTAPTPAKKAAPAGMTLKQQLQKGGYCGELDIEDWAASEHKPCPARDFYPKN